MMLVKMIIPLNHMVYFDQICILMHVNIVQTLTCVTAFLAHLSQRLIGELIVYPCSGVRRRHCRRRRCRRRRRRCCSPFSNVFSSETARPIKAKFHVEPTWLGGTNVCINGLGHMTKMAVMPIYVKNL